MRMHYDPDLKANLTYDETGRVRGISHFAEYREMQNLHGRAAAAAYVRQIAGNLNIAARALRNLDEPLSHLEPRQQDLEYRFGQEKRSFDLTTYVYGQTYLNTPVWAAGVTVTLKQAPARAIGATDNSEHGIDARLPPPGALERYRRLFATGETIDTPSPAPGAPSPDSGIVGANLLTDILGRAAKANTAIDGAPAAPQLISGRFSIYRYDAQERTEYETPALSLSPVPYSIRDGSWRLVAELVFRLPHQGVRMNWRMLVDVETNAILYLRALSSGLITAKVFTYDPVTSTGAATNTSNQSNAVLNPLRKDEELHNLDPPSGTPAVQSLRGRWAALSNITGPDIAPPTRPAGSNFDIWDVRSNEFAAVNAYYHVDRFFRLVEDLGFQVTGPDGYFGSTRFPIEVDHRGYRAPWLDANVPSAALIGRGNGIEAVYYALADFKGGGVARVNVTEGGRGYTSPPAVKFTGGGGSGAAAIVRPEDIVDGAVTAVTVVEVGKGYMTAPLVKFSGGDGTGAFATAEIDAQDPVGIATDWRVTLHELAGHGILWAHIGQGQLPFAHSAGDSFAMILNDYLSEWHSNRATDRFLLIPFTPSVPMRRSDRGVAEQSVARVHVIDPGHGYLTVTLSGGGVDEAKAVVRPHDINGGVVTRMTVTDPGTGYTSAPSVNFSGGGGTGAAAAAEIGPSGSVTRVTITNGGRGYTTPPRVNFTGGGPARAGVKNLHIIGGTITKVTVADPGSGYTSAPSVTITGGGGTGAAATAQIGLSGSVTAITVTSGGSGYGRLTARVSGGGAAAAEVRSEDMDLGSVVAVTVTDGGAGYTSTPSVLFKGGGGTGAAAIAQISSGTVTGVTVTSGGTGYLLPPAVGFTGGGIHEAVAFVNPEDIVDGAVTRVTVALPGTGYTTVPTVSFSGGGSGVSATAELGTWGWGGGMDLGTDGRLGSGYFSEQILSTTMFRAYRAIGGDATDARRREFAARCMSFLMLQAIATSHSPKDLGTAADFLLALQKADTTDWTSEGVLGGAYRKVLEWAFEKQNLNRGAPPSVDVYIDDGRAGEYRYEPVYWGTTAIWNRRNPDGREGHQEPAPGLTNFAYVKIRNRGTSVAENVIVRGYHCRPSAGLLWPTDLQPFITSQLSAGTFRPDNAEEKTVGPFDWVPAHDAWGHDCMVMIVSAAGDPSNADKFSGHAAIEDWRLVPNDNNIAQRNLVLVPGGGGARGLMAGLHSKGLWVGNPGRSPARIAASVVLPPLLAERGWRFALRGLGAKGARMKPGERRLVTFGLRAGEPFTTADAEAASERDIVVTVTANGAIIGGMIYRIDRALRMPHHAGAPEHRG